MTDQHKDTARATREIIGTLWVAAMVALIIVLGANAANAGHIIEDFDGNIPAGAVCDETIIGGDGHVSGDYAFGIFREFAGTSFPTHVIVFTHGEDIFLDPDDPRFQAGRSGWDRLTKCKLPPEPTTTTTTTFASSTTTSMPSTSTSSTIPTSTTVPSTTTTDPTSTTSSSTTIPSVSTTATTSTPPMSTTSSTVPPTTTTDPGTTTTETPEGGIPAGGGAMADTGWRSGWPWIFGGLLWVLVAAFGLAIFRGGDIDDE